MAKKKAEEEEVEIEESISETPLYIELYSTYGTIPAGLYKWSEADPVLISLYENYKKDGVMFERPDGEGNATVRVYTEEVHK